jgi:hypothetical protein
MFINEYEKNNKDKHSKDKHKKTDKGKSNVADLSNIKDIERIELDSQVE